LRFVALSFAVGHRSLIILLACYWGRIFAVVFFGGGGVYRATIWLMTYLFFAVWLLVCGSLYIMLLLICLDLLILLVRPKRDVLYSVARKKVPLYCCPL